MMDKTLSFAPSSSARRSALVGAFALAATIFPLDARGTDNPKLDADQTGNILPLPPIPYLGSMQGLNRKLSPPLFKIDTLLAPFGISPPERFQFPAENVRISMN